MKAILSFSLVLSSAALLPATPALAQSGSRVCGYTAPNDEGTIGLMWEGHVEDPDYGPQCNNAINTFAAKIQKSPELKKLQWTKFEKVTCESVGAKFTSQTNPDVDMCGYTMTGQNYQVQRTVKTNKTTYTKM